MNVPSWLKAGNPLLKVECGVFTGYTVSKVYIPKVVKILKNHIKIDDEIFYVSSTGGLDRKKQKDDIIKVSLFFLSKEHKQELDDLQLRQELKQLMRDAINDGFMQYDHQTLNKIKTLLSNK